MAIRVAILKKTSSRLDGLTKRLKSNEGGKLDVVTVTKPNEIPANIDMLIRWGNILGLENRKFRFVVNKQACITDAADKLNALKIFSKAKIPVPPFATDKAGAIKLGYPILGREAVHSKGTDIKIIIQKKDLDVYDFQGINFDYFLKYIPTEREFRVHVFAGEIIKINRKVFVKKEVSYVPFNRSEENGYFFSTDLSAETNQTLNNISEVAIKAVAALDLHFGAVDLVKSEDGNIYVLEVNTAPGIDGDELCYVQAIKKYVESKTENTQKQPKRVHQEVETVGI